LLALPDESVEEDQHGRGGGYQAERIKVDVRQKNEVDEDEHVRDGEAAEADRAPKEKALANRGVGAKKKARVTRHPRM
jgi:hypothetical protein